MSSPPPHFAHLVLLGGGHAQLAVLRAFAMGPLPGLRITLISRDVRTPYSGMLPGAIEGYYHPHAASIDLGRLATWAGARFIHASSTGIDTKKRRVLLANHPPIHYDRLAINIGSTPPMAAIPGAAQHAIPVKPVDHFMAQLPQLAKAKHIAIIGGGVAGAELAMALRQRFIGQATQFTLIEQQPRLAIQLAMAASRLVHAACFAHGIKVMLNTEVTRITAKALSIKATDTKTESSLAADATIMATGASPPAWLGQSPLATDAHGFIVVDDSLVSVSHPDVFAAGDIASVAQQPRPKSGVYAVRAGPLLAENLRASLTGKKLRRWRAQRKTLALIGTGKGKAIFSRGKFALGATGWAWWLKEAIDRRFINKYSRLPTMKVPPRGPLETQFAKHASGDPAFKGMVCFGCGAKSGWGTLNEALAAAYAAAKALRPDLHFAKASIMEDAATRPAATATSKTQWIETVDMLSPIISDRFTFGRIAALHAMSDLFAVYATPATAQIMLVVERAARPMQQDDIIQLLTGVLIELGDHATQIIGGHTTTADNTLLGLAVGGSRAAHPPIRPAQVGDVLILTKPLGIGILLAAYHQQHNAVSHHHIDQAIATMLVSNALATQAIARIGLYAMTDVTGFGLLRHCQSLLARTNKPLSAEISLAAIPFLVGAEDLAAAGVKATLAEDNWANSGGVLKTKNSTAIPLLCDPQTSGGLLVAVPAAKANAVMASLKKQGQTAAAIGRVVAATKQPTIIVKR